MSLEVSGFENIAKEEALLHEKEAKSAERIADSLRDIALNDQKVKDKLLKLLYLMVWQYCY